jgi:uracil-DNA glycosylase
MASTISDQLNKIKDEIVALKVSPLYEYRTKNNYFPVIGEGDQNAKIMFIGEAPGKNEALTGKPFCGSAGTVFDDLLNSVQIKRADVYVTSIVKDRPPDNRDPTPQEIELYSPFLFRQIQIIKPKVIATLGRFSMVYIMEKLDLEKVLQPISKIHGQHFKTKTSYGEVIVIPFYHPAVALYKASQRAVLKEDFKILRQFANQ